MKSLTLFRAIVGAGFMIMATASYAQPAQAASGNSSDTKVTGASAPMTAKALRAANRALSKKVLKALAITKGVDSSRVFVKALDGNVVLSGSVTDASQIPLISQAAQRVPGVKSVTEKLVLKATP